MSAVFFWIAFIFVLYTYIGYPLLLFFWTVLFPGRKKSVTHKNIFQPPITVIIAVKNGESLISKRLDNLLSCRYPDDLLQILVVSDGSTDRTVSVVEQYINKMPLEEKCADISCIALKENRGKPHALNIALERVTGDIVVFADVRQVFDEHVFTSLIKNFSDESIGCVSGELHFRKSGDSEIAKEMGLYWRLEKQIRKMESRIASTVGATGAIYAARADLINSIPGESLLDDVIIPMDIVCGGYRCLFDSGAKAYDTVSDNSSHEWKRKVRTLAGNWQLINLRPAYFFPWSNPVWGQFVSHKFFRLLVPFLLVVLFVLSVFLKGSFYDAFLVLQIVLYGIAFLGWLEPAFRTNRFVNLVFFFCLLNGAALAGFFYWAGGKCNDLWLESRNQKGT
jgi:cellulose synthase/poly-beta-1,6-N-acetylglucosamine synthase-like glycosyltransferase